MNESDKKKARRIILLAVFCVGLLMIVFTVYSLQEKNRTEKVVTSEKKNEILACIPNISQTDLDALSAENIYAVYGKVKIEGQNLSGVLSSLKSDRAPYIAPYMYPVGPVFGFSRNKLGCIEVYLNEDMSVNKTASDKIYHIINSSGRDGENADIPVIFIKARPPESDVTYYSSSVKS
jgi:hypothetical protein